MDVSIIIVNFNTRDLLRDCIHSIHQTVQDLDYEIIVVDNGSGDGSIAMLEEEFPYVTIIKNSENLGFAAANNQALEDMKGRYALLLNSDTVLTANAALVLYTFMESHPKAAMACGQLMNADGTKQNSIANFPSLITLMTNAPALEYLFPGSYPSKRYDYKEPIEIDSGVGACLIVRKWAIDEVGKFDERYFFFFEETDWAMRMKKFGWKVYYVPTAKIYHLQGQSIGRDVRSRIEFYLSRYQYFKKWTNPGYYGLVRIVVFIRLVINCCFITAATILCLGLVPKIRDKSVVYWKLIRWHLSVVL